MTLNELTYMVRDLLKLDSDDSEITNEHIKYLIGITRNKYVKQYLNDVKKRIPSILKQKITLNLEMNESQGFSDKKFLVSVEDIPELISSQSHYNRTTLSTISNVTRNFSMTSYRRLPYVGIRGGMQNIIYGAIDNDKLFLVSGDDRAMFLDKINLEGIFSDPKAAWLLSDSYSSSESFDEAEYPIEAAMGGLIINEVAQMISMRFNILGDEVNDSEETTQG